MTDRSISGAYLRTFSSEIIGEDRDLRQSGVYLLDRSVMMFERQPHFPDDLGPVHTYPLGSYFQGRSGTGIFGMSAGDSRCQTYSISRSEVRLTLETSLAQSRLDILLVGPCIYHPKPGRLPPLCLCDRAVTTGQFIRMACIWERNRRAYPADEKQLESRCRVHSGERGTYTSNTIT